MLSLIQPHEGEATILDQTYTIRKNIALGPEKLSLNQRSLNMHEFKTADNGTRALHLTRLPKKASRQNSKVIGYDGNCYVGYDGFEELDVSTWEPTFTWNSEDHIGLDESFVTQQPVEKRCGKRRKAWEFL
jgi:hypothetical protein